MLSPNARNWVTRSRREIILTENAQEATSRSAGRDVQRTPVSPIGNVDPEAGVHSTLSIRAWVDASTGSSNDTESGLWVWVIRSIDNGQARSNAPDASVGPVTVVGAVGESVHIAVATASPTASPTRAQGLQPILSPRVSIKIERGDHPRLGRRPHRSTWHPRCQKYSSTLG